MSPGRLLLAFCMGLGVSILCVHAVLSHEPMKEADFELVIASPSSVTVVDSGKKPFVEIYLPGDPIRYRVAIERFRDFDQPERFLRAASHSGSVLRFHIERGARQHPEIPRLDKKPTVFIESMAVGDEQFYSLAQRIAWHERNQLYARILAVAFSLSTLYLGWRLSVERRKRMR